MKIILLLIVITLSGCGGGGGGGGAVVNTAPTLASISNQSTNEDTAKTVTLSGSDAEGSSLTYSATSSTGNVLLSISGTTLTLTPAANWNGISTIFAKVNDGTVDSTAQTFVLTVSAVNDAPTLASISNQSTNANTAKSLWLDGSDIDGNGKTYSATSSASQVTPSISGETLTLTPANNWTGTSTINAYVNDGTVNSAAQTFTLTVNNRAPIISAIIPDSSALVGASFSLDISSYLTDPDSQDTLTFSATLVGGASLPSWLSLNSSTGVLSGTSASSNIGNIFINAIATDPSNSNVSDNFSITIPCNATISGTSGTNSLSATSSYDIINGYGGTDTVVFTGNYSDYTVSQTRAKLLKVVDNRSNGGSNQNTNILHSIEELEFANLTKVVSHSGSSEFIISADVGYGKTEPEIIELSNCGLLSSWTSESNQDGDGQGVYNQMFSFDGELNGSEFKVNTITNGNQHYVKIAQLNNGKTVNVWVKTIGSANHISAQIFNEDGTTSGSEFVVSNMSNLEFRPQIAALANGGFVIAWFSDRSADGVYGQKYNESGAAVGSHFAISDLNVNAYTYPTSIAAFANDSFFVVWNGNLNTTRDIKGALFDSATNRIGNIIQINTSRLGFQNDAKIAKLPNQQSVVTWYAGAGVASSTGGIYAQVLSAMPSSVGTSGSEFLVSRTESGGASLQQNPDIANFGANGFSLCWRDTYRSSDNGIYCRIYTAAGSPLGAEFILNTYAANNSITYTYPSLSALNDGGFIVTSDTGSTVIGQRFDSTGTNLKVISLTTK